MMEPTQGTQFGLLEHYWLYTLREKELLLNMNKLEITSQFVVGYFWANRAGKSRVMDLILNARELQHLHKAVDVKKVETDIQPPTKFNSNPLLFPYQQIVDTYGIPRYQELNPAVFCVVSFPFLFALMFGDVGHGALLLGFSLLILMTGLKYRSKGSFIWAVWPYRMLLLSMGLFAVYCGFIYNEFFGLSIPLTRSCYIKAKGRYVRVDPDCISDLGMDSVWGKSNNEIPFMNSFKMKLSITVGVIQMLLGLFLKGVNAVYFKDWLSFWFEFIPQFLFMSCTFGYMVFCIVMKWVLDWHGKHPPSIINLFIAMVTKIEVPLWTDATTQLYTQRVLAGRVLLELQASHWSVFLSCSSPSRSS